MNGRIFVIAILLGILAAFVLPANQLHAQTPGVTAFGNQLVACASGNVEASITNSAYGNVNGQLNFNVNWSVEFDCSNQQDSACAVCGLIQGLSSATSDGPYDIQASSFYNSGYQGCNSSWTATAINTVGPLTPNTYYLIRVSALPCASIGNGPPQCDPNLNDYPVEDYVYFNGNGN